MSSEDDDDHGGKLSLWRKTKLRFMKLIEPVHLKLREPRIMYRVRAVSVVIVAIALAYFAGKIWWRNPQSPVIVTNGISAADDPRWPKLEKHLDDCNVQLQRMDDDESLSFFQEASAVAPVDMSDAMNRYLYYAIMHAVVLRRPFAGTAAGQKKVGKGEVKMYLDLMLDRMKNEEITSKDAPTEFREMNRYLYLTIVQAGVLEKKYPAPPVPDPNPPPIPPPVPVPGVKTELEKAREEVKELTVKLNIANSLTVNLNTKIHDLEMQLLNKRADNVKLTSDLKTCKQDCDDCNRKLNGCQANKKPNNPTHGPGDDDDYHY